MKPQKYFLFFIFTTNQILHITVAITPTVEPTAINVLESFPQFYGHQGFPGNISTKKKQISNQTAAATIMSVQNER